MEVCVAIMLTEIMDFRRDTLSTLLMNILLASLLQFMLANTRYLLDLACYFLYRISYDFFVMIHQSIGFTICLQILSISQLFKGESWLSGMVCAYPWGMGGPGLN